MKPRRKISAGLVSCGLARVLTACEPKAPEPVVVESLVVSIDAGNNCSMQDEPIECAQVAAVIRSRYPTSKPRVHLCLDKQARFEAAVEVMKSVGDAGFTVGDVACGKSSSAG